MELKKIEIDAKLIIHIQSEKQIAQPTIDKAKLMAEIDINTNAGLCLLDDEGTKVLVRCHIDGNNKE